MRFRILLWRALRLRCPLCGQGKLFRGWFASNDRCSSCGADLKREPGFYLGSIYYNYGLTSLIVAIAYPLLLFSGTMSNDALLYSSLAFVVIFPLWFFRYARSLWLGFDQLWDPKPGEVGTGPAAKS
jgi:uncharacterized protein (DUF983 family)